MPEQNSSSSSIIATPSSSGKRKNDADLEASNKRLKSTLLQPAFTKHPRFWIPDGNILIQIGSTRFKLHCSRLASQSCWFEQLFKRRLDQQEVTQTGSQDSDSADINDIRIEEASECTLYYLDSTGVLVKDFETLLVAMDDCMYVVPVLSKIVRTIFAAAITTSRSQTF